MFHVKPFVNKSDPRPMTPKERREYGYARVRNIAFDAVSELWRRRQKEGMTRSDLIRCLDCDPAWLSRNLRGPGNWTLRTIGAFVEALNGELELQVHGMEDAPSVPGNYHAYADYLPAPTSGVPADQSVG